MPASARRELRTRPALVLSDFPGRTETIALVQGPRTEDGGLRRRRLGSVETDGGVGDGSEDTRAGASEERGNGGGPDLEI